MSVMRRFQERMRNQGKVLAELPAARRKNAGPQGTGVLAGKQLEEFLSASLAEDLAALKSISSVERKIAHKRDTLLPKYAPYVERLEESSATHELLGYYLVWLFDAGNIDEAVQFADYCLENGVKLPERFQSDIRFFVASKIMEWAEKEQEAGRSVDPYFGHIWSQAQADPEAWNLPDDLLARKSRLKGLIAEQRGDLSSAEGYLAVALERGAKVKTALDRVRKKITAGGAASAGAPEGDSPESAPEKKAGE